MILPDPSIPPTLQPGTVLRNGARVLRARPYSSEFNDGTFIVLCEKSAFVQSEFVTWRANAKGDTFWGHYITNENAAINDYNKR